MKKLIAIVFMVLFTLFISGAAAIPPSATTFVYGQVAGPDGNGVSGVQVTVECLSNGETKKQGAGSNGMYSIWIDCPVGETVNVTAEKKSEGWEGSNSGLVVAYVDTPDINGANVPLGVAEVGVSIPEFPVTAIPMLLSALSFGLVRKRLI